ncbi:hypothetical protein N0V88_002574 [Collariella sp. IMI 366227]|nr:hypothetical protein N0V88_002574 [Collariella sp. IMI 366227]
MEHQSLIHANAAHAAAQIAYFRAIPWCAAHLSSPNLTIDQSVARALKPNALDTLISRTLNTAAAIPAYVCGLMVDVPVMTGYLNTRFERPVRTGTDVQAAVVLACFVMLREKL